MRKPLRILLVEDSEDDADLVVLELRRGGYLPLVTRTDNAEGFTQLLQSDTWDLIISDYSLPQFTGLGALRILKNHRIDLPFIVVSGTIGESLAVDTMKAGAHDYVMKDNLTRLVPAVERELREAEGRRERRRAQAALRESEQRYRDLIENANDMILTFNMEGQLMSINNKGLMVTGFSREEVIGIGIDSFCADHTAFVSLLKSARERTSGQPGPDGIMCQTEFATQDGRWLPVEVSTRLIWGESEAVGVQAIARDMSERKNLEEQLRQAQKMEAVGRLAGGVAHDFNNLLTAIIGFSQLALSRVETTDPLHRFIAEIERAGQTAASLTTQLLAFSRRQVLQFQPLNLNDIIKDVEIMLDRVIGEDVEMVTSLDPALEQIHGDPVQLEQVLINLAVNARDAMPNGGRLIIETSNIALKPGDIEPDSELEPGQFVRLVVRDTGIGMDRQTKIRIFEPFFTTKESGKGTGLGLATVYGIVKQSGGHITVRSEPGLGAEFVIVLPALESKIEAVAAPEAPDSLVKGSETILLVEDEEVVRNLAHQILRLSGYTVLEARDTRHAIDLCGSHPAAIDLVLSDVVMPEMNGPQLAKVLRNIRPGLRTLFMSGYAPSSVSPLVSQETDAPLLVKPFSPEALTRRVREMLDSKPGIPAGVSPG